VILTVEVASAKSVFNAPAELLNILSRHIVGTDVEVAKWGHGNVAVVIDCVDAEAECAPPTCAVKGDWYELGQ